MMSIKALIAGINEYGGANSLPSCVEDAHAFEKVLKDKIFDENILIKKITDEEVSKKGLKDGLKWLVQNNSPTDKLIFYFSGHGYQAEVDDQICEALVTQDGKFFDNKELAKAIEDVPNGVLTIVLDTCFSGGLEKFFDTKDVWQTKSWVEPSSDKFFTPRSGVNIIKFGLVEPNEEKGYILGAGAKKSVLTLKEFKGLLISAAQDHEPASAKRSWSNGLSVFTYALVEKIEDLGINSPSIKIIDAVADLLTSKKVIQTPVIKIPLSPAGMEKLSFLTLNETEQNMEDWYGLAVRMVPDLIQSVLNNTSKDFTPAISMLGAQEEWQKAWYNDVIRVATGVIPKILPVVAPLIPGGNIVAPVISAVLPSIVNAVQPVASKGYQEKGWQDAALRIANAATPVILTSLQNEIKKETRSKIDMA